MLRNGRAVRLTPKDVEDLHLLTGVKPPVINTVEQFVQFIEHSKTRYSDTTQDGWEVRATIDHIARKMLEENTATPIGHRWKKRGPCRQLLQDFIDFPELLFRAVFARRRADGGDAQQLEATR